MKKKDFFYDLPDELIADFPLENRTQSRLLYLNGVNGQIEHKSFFDCLSLLKKGDLLVFNNTKVIPARLMAKKPTGGKVEVMLDQIINAHIAKAQLGASRTPKEGEEIIFNDSAKAIVKGRVKEIFELELVSKDQSWFLLAENEGEIPLPPYMNRQSKELDQNRYQTVYAKEPGSVAAPTAGLHFDEAILSSLDDMGVDTAYVTLNIGAGTYLPVRTDDIKDHHMHSEFLNVTQEVCNKIIKTKENGGRVIAIGTTSVRSLETAAQKAKKGSLIEPYCGETDIFIYPGYKPKIVDALFTNFHLPESTLIMLVSALAGYSNVMKAYNEAVKEKYRFFSYGDSMFITCNPEPDCPI